MSIALMSNDSRRHQVTKFRIFAWVIALLLAGPAVGADSASRLVLQEADRVMGAIKANDARALERSMSPYMLARASPERFLGLTRTFRMHEFKDVRWNEPRHTEVVARLEGMATLADGGRRWVNLRFVKREQGWRLALVGVESADVVDEPAALDVPPAGQLEVLLAEVMQDFVDGIRERRFDQLYNSMPSNRAESFTLQQFNAGLLENITRKDYATALKVEPVLDSPAQIDDDGVLWLEGHYPVRPAIRFAHGFHYERGAWRIARFSIDPPAEQ